MAAAGHEPTSRTGEAPARPGLSPSPTADQPVPAAEAPTGASRSLAADGAWPLPRAVLVLLGGAGAVAVTAGLRSAAGIVGPAFLALTIAITIHPLLAWLQRRVPGWLAVALTMLVTYAALLAMAGALVLAAARLATLLPGYQAQFTSLVDQTTGWLGELGVTQQQLNTAVSRFDLNSLARVLQQVLIGVAGVVSDLGFILVLLFFLIIDSSTLPQRLEAAATQRPQLVEALTSFARATRQYIVVSTVFGLLVALVDVAALYWLDVPLPWLWGLLSFITNYIPNIGFVLGLLPPALLALLQGGVRQAVLVIVAYSVINLVIQSLIQPKVVGDTVGLSITLTFLSLVFWSYVIGPLGALLAVPLSLLTKALLVDADPASRWLDLLIAPVHRGAGDDPDGER
ncbi:MAG TPA: AI-2E family transporter [Actinomycetes bacterium]|nr:AI-2E family transporter [Actinomycetes bacterium]